MDEAVCQVAEGVVVELWDELWDDPVPEPIGDDWLLRFVTDGYHGSKLY